MRILLSNDDGVHAPGIQCLLKTLKTWADVTVVAPLSERSTTGHTLTLDHPLRLVEIGPQIYGCDGYPADCALMGVAHVMKENKPDVVVSGINRGANLGQDIYYSGTVAAAREACFRGVPSLAISSAMDFQVDGPQEQHFQTAADFLSDVLKAGLHQQLSASQVLNINVPDCAQEDLKGLAMTQTGFRYYSEEISERYDFKERKYYWVGGVYSGFEKTEGSDCLAVDRNQISLTLLNYLQGQSDKKDTWKDLILSKLSDWS